MLRRQKASPRCGDIRQCGNALRNLARDHFPRARNSQPSGSNLTLSALGQAASGSIDVTEDYVRLEVFLP